MVLIFNFNLIDINYFLITIFNMKNKILKGGIMKYWRLFLLLFSLIGCDIQHKNVLRIKSINKDTPLKIDVIDVYTITVDGEEIVREAIWDQHVTVEFVYTEFGLGLPTTPGTYTALLNEYEVTFEDITPNLTSEERFRGDKIKGSCNILIPADPEGEKVVKGVITIMPVAYIERYLDDLIRFRTLKAKIKFRGRDILSAKKLEVEGYLHINIGDYFDDPIKMEPPTGG